VNQALRPITEKFGKKYPFIKMTHWRADSEDIAQKASAEVRAGNVVGDVLEGTGVGEQAVQAGLLVPYTTPAIAAFPEPYRDPTNMWTPTRLSYYSIAYNTRLVPENRVPKTFEDLLDPQWKGKIAWRIGSASGTPLFITNLRLAWGEEKARAYFAKLKEQKIVNFGAGSARTLVDRVIAGEYAIALNIFRAPPADQPRERRAGELEAARPGRVDRRHHGRGEGRQAPARGAAAHRFRLVEGGAGDPARRRLFSR